MKQLKIGFKITINWNKYQSDPTPQIQNRYLNHLIDPSIQGVDRLFVLWFECDALQRGYKLYFLTIIEIIDCNAMIDGKKRFWSASEKWFNNIWKHSNDCNWLT